jgi:hypothetical protein
MSIAIYGTGIEVTIVGAENAVALLRRSGVAEEK